MNKTEIFETYQDFLKREDKSINGVSPSFAETNEDYEEDNATNEGCWNCIDCSYCSSCISCRSCSYCISCRYCRDCRDTKDDQKEHIEIPKIENIHEKVYESASKDGALDMGSWHSCETTHCRAGWVTYLAGDQGKKVEEFYGSCLAAQLIYRESGYEINPCRFFDDAETAMNDMKRLAEA